MIHHSMKKLLIAAGIFFTTAANLFAQDGKYFDFFSEEPGNSPTLFAPGIILKPDVKESDLIISPKGDELFYVLGEWPYTKIMHSEKTEKGWSQPDTATFSIGCYATEPTFSADGQWIYYSSSKGKENISNYNIWRVKKTVHGWTNPESVLNLGDDNIWEFHSSMTRNDELYFCLWDSKTQKGEIYMAQCSTDGCSNAQKVDLSVSTYYGTIDPYIDYDATYMIYATNTPGGLGDFDLYISYQQPDGRWTAPKNLGAPYNTSGPDLDLDISPDGKYIITYSEDGILWQKNTLTNN